MSKEAHKLTSDNIMRNTDIAKSLAESVSERIKRFDADFDKNTRLDARLCRTCFYLHTPTIVGRAFTKYECRHCGETYQYPNTHVPMYCEKCTSEYNVCRQCGASLE